jgi:hypothetical protein
VPRIFYLDGTANSLGMLRAVVPLTELADLLSEEKPSYLGRRFPRSAERCSPSTLIEITADEEQPAWPMGYYRLSIVPLQFEDTLKSIEH